MRSYFGKRTKDATALELQNQSTVIDLSGECMVLLENDGVLPLEPCRIALYGNGARHTVKGGTGSGDVNSRTNVNAEKGFLDAGFEVMTKEWLNKYDRKVSEAQKSYLEKVHQFSRKNGIPNQMAMFKMPFVEPEIPEISDEDVKESNTDTAIYVLSRNSGEGRDRRYEKGDYLLTDGEEKALRYLAAAYEKTILLLNTGGVIDTSVIRSIKGLNAVMITGQLGNMGGHIIAEVVSGKQVPSGKLTDTWAASYEDYPSALEFGGMNGNVDDEYYTEGIYVGYRYFDTFHIRPNYCFGYGKGYTSFNISGVDVRVEGTSVVVEAEVSNSGREYNGKEVVQVYYSAPAGTLEKPYQELAAFTKTDLLGPGEKQTVTASFDLSYMASYSEERAAYLLEKGEYVIRVGTSSRNTAAAAVIVLDHTIVTEQLENRMTADEKLDMLSAKGVGPYSYTPENEEIRSAKRIDISGVWLPANTAVYRKERLRYEDRFPNKVLTLLDVASGEVMLEDLIAQLTVREMAELCVGLHKLEAGDVVGAASNQVPGAAGETISSLEETRSIPPLIMADGPAGLRLQPHFKTTLDGRLLPGGNKRGMEVIPFPEDLPDEVIDYYQYATAIPIANTLAQSWNTKLMEEMGRIVGSEMKEFHVHLWLAPGMNIHRNPLCGRNYEYYSEDPLLSGRFAAAAATGVQGMGHQGVTIKHLAANNLEDNRMFNNSHVSERALREIYLKGFEIAVKESQPYAIMTSYNLINGIHAANHYDMLQAICRDEWGFDGVIMTDWCTSQDTTYLGFRSDVYPWASSVQCIKAGNNLQMPGCEQNVEDIVEAMETGSEITVEDLQFNVHGILKTILKCTGR